eukprot:5850102-Amphidinium_carterae.1
MFDVATPVLSRSPPSCLEKCQASFLGLPSFGLLRVPLVAYIVSLIAHNIRRIAYRVPLIA